MLNFWLQVRVLSRYMTVKLFINISNVILMTRVCPVKNSKWERDWFKPWCHTHTTPNGSVGSWVATRSQQKVWLCLCWNKVTIDGNHPCYLRIWREAQRRVKQCEMSFALIPVPAKEKAVSEVTAGFWESLQQMTARSLATRKEKFQYLYSNCHVVYYTICSAVIQKVELCSALLGSAVQNRLNLFWTLPAPRFI